MTIFFRSLLYFLIFILLHACTSGGVAPVSNRNEIKDTPPNVSKPSKKIEKKKSKERANAPKKIVKNKNDCHVVAKGDTLYSISEKFNMPVEALVKLNNLNGDILKVGQTLMIKK